MALILALRNYALSTLASAGIRRQSCAGRLLYNVFEKIN
jgi:hypothetical protein